MAALHELLKDMRRLEEQMSKFELKYGVKSEDFYAAMMRGDLEEFDALDEYRMEFLEWLALYETWLALREKYRRLIRRQPVAIHIKTNLEPTHAR